MIPQVLPQLVIGGLIAYVTVRYVVASIINFPGFNLGGGIAPNRNTVDTVHFGPRILTPLAEARMLSEGYDYDQYVQMSMVQSVTDTVFPVVPGFEVTHFLLSEDGAGLTKYMREVEPLSDIRDEDEVQAIMGNRFEGI